MKSGNVYVGTVGETVEIRCQYPDDHKYTPEYFCRLLCKSSVLIKSAKIDQVVSDGRYSLTDFVSGRFFTVTIKHLRPTDSCVYYCGVDQWFRDTLNKVHLSVLPAPVNRSTHTTENTHVTYIWTTTLTSADNSHSYEPLPSTVQSPGSTPPVNSSSGVLFFRCPGFLDPCGFSVYLQQKIRCKVQIYSSRSTRLQPGYGRYMYNGSV